MSNNLHQLSLQQATSGHKSRHLKRYLLCSPRHWNTESIVTSQQSQNEKYRETLLSCRREYERLTEIQRSHEERMEELRKKKESEDGEDQNRKGMIMIRTESDSLTQSHQDDDEEEEEDREGITEENSFFTTQDTSLYSSLHGVDSISLVTFESRLTNEDEPSTQVLVESVSGSKDSQSHSSKKIPSRPNSALPRSKINSSPRKKPVH